MKRLDGCGTGGEMGSRPVLQLSNTAANGGNGVANALAGLEL